MTPSGNEAVTIVRATGAGVGVEVAVGVEETDIVGVGVVDGPGVNVGPAEPVGVADAETDGKGEILGLGSTHTTLFQSLVNKLLPAIDLRTLLVIIHDIKIIIRP